MTQRIVSKILDSNVFVCGEDGEFFIVDAGAEVEDVALALQKCYERAKKDFVPDDLGGKRAFVEGLPKVVGVLLTHGHYDHCYFAQEYAKRFGCKIYCSAEAEEYLKNPDYNYSEGKFSVQDFSDFVFLKGDGVLSLGNMQVEYFALGGHSKSDICYHYGDEIFVGDVLLGRDMGRIDLYGGSKQAMQTSLKKLVDTNYRIMHAGHGEDMPKSAQDKVAKLWIRFLTRSGN